MRFYPLDVGSVDTATPKDTGLLLERQGLGREGPVGHRGVSEEEYLKKEDVGIGLQGNQLRFQLLIALTTPHAARSPASPVAWVFASGPAGA